MARSDLILSLVRAGARGDQPLFRKAVEAIIAEERAKQHHVLADQLSESVKNGIHERQPTPQNGTFPSELFYEITPTRKLVDLILPPLVQQVCGEVIEEQHRHELLGSHNIEPRNRILLVGAPGNGKTTLAEAIAESLMVPLISVRYDGLIGSYLGETATRLRKLFEFVRTRRCVLFFDEFDTLGKERGDAHDTGEIKRVVSSLLLQIDTLPSYVVIVTATNHAELLDRAVWRRFQIRLQLPSPSKKDVEAWFRQAEGRLGVQFGMTAKKLTERVAIQNFSDLESFCADIARRWILAGPSADMKSIVASRIQQWNERHEAGKTERNYA